MVVLINLEITVKISVLPVISKVVEKIVHNRLVDYLSQSKLLSKRQFGFRARRSTELALLY